MDSRGTQKNEKGGRKAKYDEKGGLPLTSLRSATATGTPEANILERGREGKPEAREEETRKLIGGCLPTPRTAVFRESANAQAKAGKRSRKKEHGQREEAKKAEAIYFRNGAPITPCTERGDKRRDSEIQETSKKKKCNQENWSTNGEA